MNCIGPIMAKTSQDSQEEAQGQRRHQGQAAGKTMV
jgi:hypothetical protein